MEDLIDLGELEKDEDLKGRLLCFQEKFEEVKNVLEKFSSMSGYDDFTPEEKVRYHLFQAFAINSLYWFYLRVLGVDPSQHAIKSELNRIRNYMAKSKKIYEKQTLMPRIDQEAAKRFVKSSLWTPNTSVSDNGNLGGTRTLPRKRKLDYDNS